MFIESDFHMDVDDAGALVLAMNLESLDKVRLLGFGINTPSMWGAAAAAVLRDHYGKTFPIGIDAVRNHDIADRDYARHLTVAFPSSVTATYPLSADLLRQTLSVAEDDSVTIVSIGFFSNLLMLLQTGPDSTSDLSGTELVAQKVRRTVVMGGLYPSGREFNLVEHPIDTARFLERWPCPIDFVGAEAGNDVITGRDLDTTLGPDHPLSVAYRVYSGVRQGRPSWDPLTVYLAAFVGSPLVRWSDPGRMSTTQDGSNAWTPDPAGRHRYAILAAPITDIESELDRYLALSPIR